MWPPRVMDLARLRTVPGLETLENRASSGAWLHASGRSPVPTSTGQRS